LITGATGFIGRHLASALNKQGHKVNALVRESSVIPNELNGSLIHRFHENSELHKIVSGIKPEVVIHLASLYLAEHKADDIDSLCDSNITFGTHLAEAAWQCGCRRFISAGTAWQNFKDRKGIAANLYAATKEGFESILKYYADARSLEVVILKLYDTYGSGDPRGKLLSVLRKNAGTDSVLQLSKGEQIIDLLHIHDVVAAFEKALTWNRTSRAIGSFNDFYLTSNQRLSLKELISLCERVSGKQLNIDWGARPYRDREVMVPWDQGPIFPGWAPSISLESGLRQFFSEVEHV
jgi:nucleoside-diphosphate-sugar epimerase